MEKMPFRAELDVQTFEAPAAGRTISSDWRQQLPVLTGRRCCCASCVLPTHPRSSHS